MARVLSQRAALIAVVVAFGTGLLASLALRSGESGSSAVHARAETETEQWRVPVAFGTNLKALGDNILYVTGAIDRASNREFHLQPFEPGDIVPPFSIVEAVKDGKVQAGYTWLGYDQGRIPASALISAVPFGMEPWEFTAWWYDAGGRELAEQLYRNYNVYPLLCGLIGPETAGWFRTPITSLEDVKGLKIRFAGLGGKVIERLGASVTMLPGGEIFQALEKGAIDATEYSLPIVDQQLGFDRIAKYNYFPGWHQTFTAAHLVVNLQRWQSLPEDRKGLLDTACTAGVTRNLARAEALQGPIIKAFPSKGVEAQRLPDALLRELRRVTREVLAEEAAKDPAFARILASQQKFDSDYGYWKHLAYLPRDF